MSLKRLCKYYSGQLGSWSKTSRLSFPRLFIKASVFCLAGALQFSLLCSVCFSANSPMPGEERSSLFYAVTHFSSFAYGILFLVFCLSLINLLLQLRIARGWNWPARIFGPIYPQGVMIRPVGHTSGKPGRRHASHDPDIHKINANPLDDGIVINHQQLAQHRHGGRGIHSDSVIVEHRLIQAMTSARISIEFTWSSYVKDRPARRNLWPAVRRWRRPVDPC